MPYLAAGRTDPEPLLQLDSEVRDNLHGMGGRLRNPGFQLREPTLEIPAWTWNVLTQTLHQGTVLIGQLTGRMDSQK